MDFKLLKLIEIVEYTELDSNCCLNYVSCFLSKNLGIHTGSIPFVHMLKYVTVFIGFELKNKIF